MATVIKAQIQTVIDMANPCCGRKFQHDAFVEGVRALRQNIIISPEHAHSLKRLVKWFKDMIEARGQANGELTSEYCDELLKALEAEGE